VGALAVVREWLAELSNPAARLQMQADALRDTRQWAAAAAAYEIYLKRRPRDGPIWVQRGNCLKEAGEFEGAMSAYRAAEALMPAESDVQLQLGHLNKVRGDLRGALERYRRAADLDPSNEDAVREATELDELSPADIYRHLDWSELDSAGPPASDGEPSSAHRRAASGQPRRSVEALIANLAADPADTTRWRELERALAGAPDGDADLRKAIAAAPADPDLLFALGRLLLREGCPVSGRDALRRAFRQAPRLEIARELRQLGAPRAYLHRMAGLEPRASQVFLDITDLTHVLKTRATVTGIQRLQCNLIAETQAGRAAGGGPAVDFVIGVERRAWRLNWDDLAALVEHVETHGESGLEERRRLIDRACDRAVWVAPQAGDAVIVSGVPYLTPEIGAYGQSLRAAGAMLGAIIHDFIPLTHPQYALPSYTRAFSQAMADMVAQLDFALPNSEFTAAETRRLMQAAGYRPIPIKVVRLAHTLRATRPGDSQVDEPVVGAWRGVIANLKDEPFVLCVGTFAAHKNQELLINVWRRLVARGMEPPTLVLVGHKAHGVADLFHQLETTRRLDGRVRLLEGVDDDQIETLYGACLFTMFPSHVEGWGLPVGESLAHGKVCVASSAASIPEVGGEFAIYIDPDDVGAATDVVAGLLREPARLAFLERRLRARFRPRSWSDYAGELIAAVEAARTAGVGRAPVIKLAPGRVLMASAPPEVWEFGAALPPPEAEAHAVLRQYVLAEGWRHAESWGVWMDGRSARLRLSLDAEPGARIVLALHLRAAPWADAEQVIVRAACGGSAVALTPPALSGDTERSVPRNLVVMLECLVSASGDVELSVEVTGKAAPSWWDERRTLVLGLVRLMFLPAEPAQVGLRRGRTARPGTHALGPTSRFVPMAAETLALALRARLAMIEGWRPQGPGAAWMSGARASLAFQADATPGAPLRVVVSALRREVGTRVVIELSAGSDAANVFEQGLCASHVGAECVGLLTVGSGVIPAVARELVPAFHDAPHHGGVPFGDPAESEEGGVDAGAVEHFEDAIDVGLDPPRVTVPVGSADAMSERLDLEVVLDVDRHGIDDGGVNRGHERFSF